MSDLVLVMNTQKLPVVGLLSISGRLAYVTCFCPRQTEDGVILILPLLCSHIKQRNKALKLQQAVLIEL